MGRLRGAFRRVLGVLLAPIRPLPDITAGEWLTTSWPTPMLDYLAGRASERKLRLFACACCRRIWHLLRRPSGREAVEGTERYADGCVAISEWEAVRGAAHETLLAHSWTEDDSAHRAAVAAASANAWEAAVHAAAGISLAVMQDRASSAQEDAAQANLLRCVFGNPFRPVALDPNRRTATVLSLAQAAYDERQLPAGTLDPQRLSVLADALEETGADSALVAHLRGEGPHVRGCWAVDLALGRS